MKKFGLCRGRHEIRHKNEVVNDFIFNNEVNPLDVNGLEQIALETLSAIDNNEPVALYVTGLSVALIAVVNAAIKLDQELTLYHYDRETGDYYPQKLAITGEICPFCHQPHGSGWYCKHCGSC